MKRTTIGQWLILAAASVVLIFIVYSIMTAKSPTQRAIESLKQIEIGVDEKALKEAQDGLKQFKQNNP